MARLRVALPQPSPTPSQNVSGSDRSNSLETVRWPTCDIFNTTFSLYRASPLFVGPHGLSESRLRVLEARLRDILTGDSVRGIQVGLGEDDDGSMGNAGALESVAIEWASVHEILATLQPALQVTLQYENAQCMAILLPMPEGTRATDGTAADPSDAFLGLPLLLFRMPTSLKDTITRFLSSAFDCRITPLCLSRRDIVRSLESWASATALPTTGPLAGEVVITLAFGLPELRGGGGVVESRTPDYATDLVSSAVATDVYTAASPDIVDSPSIGLKTIDVFVPNADLGGFLRTGKQLGAALDDLNDTPFTAALSYYLSAHLGLDMSSPVIEVVRVACGGFVLSTNRLKILRPPRPSPSATLDRHFNSIPRIFGDIVLRATG